MGERRPSEVVDEFETLTPLKLPTYTTSTLPAAADHTGKIAGVSDIGAGNVYGVVISNGTNWVDVGTGATVVA